MLKKLLLPFFALLCFTASGQGIFQKPNNSYGTTSNRQSIDSTLYFPTGCGVPTDTTWLFSQSNSLNQKLKKAALYYDSCGHKIWIWDPHNQGWAGFSSGVIDTTSLSNRINGKLNTSDTALMLLNYARSAEVVANLSGAPGLLEDVAANRPVSAITGVLFLAVDTKLLYRYNGTSWDLIGGGGGSTIDTTSLSNRINLKIDSIRRKTGSDSVFMYYNGTKAFAFRDSIGTTSAYDSASSQGGGFHTQPYNDTRYLKRADSATAYSTVKRVADTAAALRAAIAALTGTDTTIFKATGASGLNPFTLGSSGSVNQINFPKIRDTSAGATQYAGDSALAIATHDSTSSHGLLPIHRLADSTAVLRSLIGSAGGSIPPNAGAAFRIYQPQTPAFRSLKFNAPLIGDTVTAGQIGVTADTTAGRTHLATQSSVQDSAAVLRGLIGGGGGGSQTFPQVLATGRTFPSDDSVLLSGGRLYFKGNEIKSDSMRVRSQFIVGDTLYTWSRILETWGYSVDIGNAQTTPLPFPYVTYLAQALGFYNNNRAIGGTTLCRLVSSDSSMESRMNQISTYDANNPGILLFGGYSLNDPLNGVDSNRFKIVWDSVLVTIAHTAKGWPYSRMFMVGGTYYDTTAAGYTAHGLGYTFGQISYRKALQYGIPTIDGFAYLKAHGAATNLWPADNWHLNELGQTRLAIGILNAMTGDSVNYSRANNSFVMNMLSVNGKTNLYGNLYTAGSHTTLGNDSIGGTLGVDTLTSSVKALSDFRILGGPNFDSTWINIYNSGPAANKLFGWGMKGFSGFFNHLWYVPDVGAKGFMWGVRSTTTSAFTPHTFLSMNGGLTLDDSLNVSGTTFLKDTKIQGGTVIDAQKWNIYNSTGSAGTGNKWGYGLASHSGLYSIDAYSAATGGGGFRWGILNTDGVTYVPHAFMTQTGALELDDSLGVRGLTRLAAATITGRITATNPGGTFSDQMIGLYDVTVNHFGMGMGLVDGTNYMTKVYGQSAGNSGVAFGIIKSDGVTFQPFLMVGSTIRIPSAQLPTGTTTATDSVFVIKSGGVSAVDTGTKVAISAIAPATNLGGTQNATNYTITSTTGTSYNMLTATVNLAGLVDTAHYRTLDSLKNRTITGFGGPSFYQTVQSNLSSQTQRAKLNFGPDFTLTDNGGNGSTDISMATAKLTSGRYTPVISATTNISTSTAYPCFYTRIDSIVTVSGTLSITPTTTTTATTFDLTIPISSSFTDFKDASGIVAEIVGATSPAGTVIANTANGKFTIGFTSSLTGGQAYLNFTVTYIVH